MRIWHQSLTVLNDVSAYSTRMQSHIRRVARADTEVVLHGLAPGTYPANYPGDDLAYAIFLTMHGLQCMTSAWKAQQEGYDAYALCTLPDPMIREMRAMVDIPVVGLGESCFLTIPTLGQKFAVLAVIDLLSERYREQIAGHGLADRCVGVFTADFEVSDVMKGFDNPGPLIDRFRANAQRLIDAGADVIIPGEGPLSLLLASEGVFRVGDVPLIDTLALTIKIAEMKVDLRKTTGLIPSRKGWSNASPRKERLEEVLRFYGLGKFMDA